MPFSLDTITDDTLTDTSAGDLVGAVRAGHISAYGELFLLHRDAAYRLARQLARNPLDVDELVATAYDRVLQILRTGRGPRTDRAFRAYLLTTMRHLVCDQARRARKLELCADVAATAPAADRQAFVDAIVDGLETSMVTAAYATLPERWQAVLWHTEIEGLSPPVVAPLLGLSPNAVSALAYRAREGLRQAYLQQHLTDPDNRWCRSATRRMGAWLRGGLAKREVAIVRDHLAECPRCREVAAELVDVAGPLVRAAA
jgi:RNA polymerase sigma factor (sigma-70 family)